MIFVQCPILFLICNIFSAFPFLHDILEDWDWLELIYCNRGWVCREIDDNSFSVTPIINYSVWPPECRQPPECRFLGKMVSDASYQTIHGKMVPNFQFWHSLWNPDGWCKLKSIFLVCSAPLKVKCSWLILFNFSSIPYYTLTFWK